MEQKILILGAGGMLGHDLAKAFKDSRPVLWTQSDLNITNQSAVVKKITAFKPTIVINAAAYTNVDGAETNVATAFQVNADGPGYIAEACQQLSAIMVHFSTEYVFDGTNQAGYREDDPVNPLNIYGQSKAKGEELVRNNCEMHYIIRSSWLYGKAPQVGKPRGLNFVETMLKLAGEGKEINVVNDQFGKPTFTLDLARQTKEILNQFKPCGTYHVVNEGVCTWYDFAKKIFELRNLSVKLNPITSQEYKLPTPRPKYSVLVNTKLEPLRKWQEALDEYLK